MNAVALWRKIEDMAIFSQPPCVLCRFILLWRGNSIKLAFENHEGVVYVGLFKKNCKIYRIC